MIRANRIKSAGGAADYLSKTDDYYREGDQAPTQWHGQGAERLGLRGEVDGKEFERLLNGRLPDGTQLTAGKDHAPGHDLTISAPKSVSIAALAGGDHRLVEAHDAAVAAAIAHVEQYAATTRIKEYREIRTVATDNIAVATFRHASSREKEPQLHTHAIVLNMTQDDKGQWRSFESRAMYHMQRELDTVYKNELARYCREAGYQLETTKDGFEIKGVDKGLMQQWSSRNEQIEAELAKIGKTRETATAAERETAALNTRKDKEPADHANMREAWREQALDRGHDLAGLVRHAEQSQSTMTTPAAQDRAMEAVKQAAEHLTERQSRFSQHDLEKQAMRFAGVGGASKDEIRQAIELARTNGDLLDRQTYTHSTHTGQRAEVAGFTTKELVEEESAMLQHADNAISGTAREVTIRHSDRDIALATAALRGAEHLRNDVIMKDRYLSEQMKSGKREFDSTGRMYIRTTDGQVICPDMHAKGKVHESANINHFGLTKTKYIVTDKGVVLKQGGTLKSELAGWLGEKARRPDAGIVTKAAAKALKNGENWRKAGAIESIVVRQIVNSKAEATREATQKALERQATGVRSVHVLEQKAVCTQAQAEKAIKAQEVKTGFAMNDGQRAATVGILTDRDRITLVQGFAGTAKTTSCLDSAARELQRQGYEVKAMAPTNDAAKVLGDAIGDANSRTVAKHLAELEKQADRDPTKKQVWIVDEASLLSAKDMTRLLREAEKSNAKLVMVGDVKQLGSVERGAAFRQLQEQTQLKTYKLDEIVRQRSGELKAAVNESIRGEVKQSLDRIEKEGGLKELKTRDERVNAIARDYSALTREQREQTIVIAPGRDDKAQIDQAIREELKRDGTLTGEAKTVDALEKKDMTRVEQKIAASYERGDVVRDKNGDFARVVAVDAAKNQLLIERKDGATARIDPAKAKLDGFREVQKEIQSGDKIRVTAPIKAQDERGQEIKIANGQKLDVTKIEGSKVHCRTADGKAVRLDMAHEDHRQLTHGYASTTFPAQGKTADRVLIHAESSRLNLQSQQNYYVAISRAQDSATVYTDNKDRLAKQLESHTGQKETALESRAEQLSKAQQQELKRLEERYIKAELDRGTPIAQAIERGEQQARQDLGLPTKTQEQEAAKAKASEADKARDEAKKAIAKAKEDGKDIAPIVKQQQSTQTQAQQAQATAETSKQQQQQQQQERTLERERGMER